MDAVLQKKNVEVILSLIEELIDRNVLKLALMNRNENGLMIILEFIKWKIRDPKATNILIYVFDLIIEFYLIIFSKSQSIQKLLYEISNIISEEIKMENQLTEINKKIDLLINIKNN